MIPLRVQKWCTPHVSYEGFPHEPGGSILAERCWTSLICQLDWLKIGHWADCKIPAYSLDGHHLWVVCFTVNFDHSSHERYPNTVIQTVNSLLSIIPLVWTISNRSICPPTVWPNHYRAHVFRNSKHDHNHYCDHWTIHQCQPISGYWLIINDASC